MLRHAPLAYPGDRVLNFIDVYGHTHSVYAMFERRIMTDEPDYIKAILSTNFRNFEKGEIFDSMVKSMLGKGVFNSDGDLWKFHRGMTRPFFSRDRISHFDIFNRHAEDAIVQMTTRLREGHAVDFQDLVSRFTLDSATEFLFGIDARSLSIGLPYPASSRGESADDQSSDAFARAFADAQSSMASRSRFGNAWPLWEFWEDKTNMDMEVINEFVEPIVKEAISKKRKKPIGLGEELEEAAETLLDHLVNLTEDYSIIKDETLNIMLAGRDTTASTLTFTVYMLSQHPNVLQRLREEISVKIGDARRPTQEDLRDMRYLRAVINETLRLYPPVPFNMRLSLEDTIWPSRMPGQKPFFVPAGSRVLFSVFLMHRRTDLWGPDALEFDPDRFLDERVHKYLTANPFIFLPFSAGPRICLGQQFAYNEVSLMLVRLLQTFSSIELATDAQPASSLPPAVWAEAGGRQAREKIRPKAHLTLYCSACILISALELMYANFPLHLQEGLWVRMGDEAVRSEAV
ncbi:hypothetical protein EW146_g4358 [Bondarzewia mesenterica]|uniref:Cytochrome P450 n=1 Tax=Bondarzewia mesenterica TaxID=1095465 RepID=A0A4S4LWM3_9AGAM|nr:hypothetical protein EW146_g4358 [Bondarzewia mesenterica]